MMLMCSLAEKNRRISWNWNRATAIKAYVWQHTWQVDTVIGHQNEFFDIENFRDVMMKLANIFPLPIDADIGVCLVIGVEMTEIDFNAKNIGIGHFWNGFDIAMLYSQNMIPLHWKSSCQMNVGFVNSKNFEVMLDVVYYNIRIEVNLTVQLCLYIENALLNWRLNVLWNHKWQMTTKTIQMKSVTTFFSFKNLKLYYYFLFFSFLFLNKWRQKNHIFFWSCKAFEHLHSIRFSSK